MIAFAESPAGRHYLVRASSLDTEESVIDAQMKLLEDVTPLLEQIQKDLCAERATQRIAAGDKNAKCPLSTESKTQAG